MPLPGMNTGVMAAGVAGSTLTLAFIAGTTDTDGQACTLMASISAGDLLLVASFAENPSGGPPSDVTPSGWTKLYTASASNTYQFGSTRGGSPTYRTSGARLSVYYKIADGTESSTDVNFLSGNDTGHHVAQYRPSAGSIAGVVVKDTASRTGVGGGAIPAALTADAADAAVPSIVVSCYGHNDAAAMTHSETMDYDGVNGDAQHYAGFLLQTPGSAVDVTGTPTDAPSDPDTEVYVFVSLYVEVS